MSAPESAVAQLDRLAKRIVAGDVVFFVGAGFSIDSEGNSAGVLVARLVARFEAIADTVAAAVPPPSATLIRLCGELKVGLRKTFTLLVRPKKAPDGDIWHDPETNITRLADNYYQINDWMCSAFDCLLVHWTELDGLNPAIHRLENQYLAKFHGVDKVGHKLPLTLVDFPRFGKLLEESQAAGAEGPVAGKALFLDTMGFEDRTVMAGNFLAASEYVSGAYLGRLRPRHYALAWMAHERWLPVLVTTNYDLLLEGAFRLAGMQPLMADEYLKNPLDPAAPAASDLCLSRRIQNFTPIADATEFFAYGDGHEAAMLLKIHGCVYRYRYESRTNAGWRDVLPSMVFTFREIQNWREDSWARDFLQTLMRTRTVAFAGYSTADPVIHDTFRSVYEEMARYRARRHRLKAEEAPQGDPPVPESGNAFYYGAASKREFHALEMLRASSVAVGASRLPLTSHPNLIPFHFEPGSDFPTLDEVMQWTYHAAYRKLQTEALTAELRRVFYQLFAKPCPDTDWLAIIASFAQLVEDEGRRADRHEQAVRDAQAAIDPKAPDADPDKTRRLADAIAARRGELQRTVGWTAHFHRNLMRELTAADVLVREPARGSRVHAAMRWPWYAALSDHPEWGAWAVVVELALRSRSASWVGAPGRGTGDADWIEPIPADRAAVLLPNVAGTRARIAPRMCLSIEVPELRIMSNWRESARTLHLLPRVALLLRAHAVPWRRQHDRTANQLPLPAPTPRTLWKWALGQRQVPRQGHEAWRFFGGADVRPFGRTATQYSRTAGRGPGVGPRRPAKGNAGRAVRD